MNKEASVLWLTVGMLFETASGAVSDNVTLKTTVTTEKRLVVLYVDGEYRNGRQLHYMLVCAQDQSTCRVPDKGRYYHMEGSDQAEDSGIPCPEVNLTEIGEKKPIGVYCLNDTH